MTYAQEKAIKDRDRAARAPKYVFTRAGMDLLHPYPHTPANGTLVVKTQPYGTPRNGTMGQCYVAGLDGRLIGMVDLRSLALQKKVKK